MTPRPWGGSTLAERRAASATWNARHAHDPADGLVCVSDEEQLIEDPRTKAIVGVRRVRTYSNMRRIGAVVAVQYDDGPLELVERPSAPPPRPVPDGFIRRWARGSRPAKDRPR